MADINDSELPEMLKSIMASPEISEILKSINTDEGESEKAEPASEVNTGGGTVGAGAMPSLTPEMLSKLPAIMSMLSSMGIGSGGSGGEKSAPVTALPSAASEKQRKALLSALKPYLNPKRRSVVDGMMQLGNLTELFSQINPGSATKE